MNYFRIGFQIAFGAGIGFFLAKCLNLAFSMLLKSLSNWIIKKEERSE